MFFMKVVKLQSNNLIFKFCPYIFILKNKLIELVKPESNMQNIFQLYKTVIL